MIKVYNINKKYGESHILKNISFNVKKGETISIIGSSGAGKSTLIRCLNLLIKPDEGDIIINGESVINSDNIYKIRQKIGMVFQDYNLFEHLTVKENITIAPIKLLKKSKEEATELATKLLNMVELGDKIDCMPSELSGGQKQRVAIARALAMEPDILLFDEPTSALDPLMKNEVLSIMYKLSKEGMTMIIVTHEMDFAEAISDRTIFMCDGEIIEDDIPEIIFEKAKDERTRKFVNLELSNKYIQMK